MSPSDLNGFLKRHGLNYRTFAELIGVTEGGASHWMTGRRSIPLSVARLCKLFDRYPDLMREFGKEAKKCPLP